MSIPHASLSAVLVALAVAASSGQTQPPVPAADDLRLADFQPRSMLRVHETEVTRARFPVVDFHQHVRIDANGVPVLPVDHMLQTMDQVNVRTLVHLTGGHGERLGQAVDALSRPHPDRFVVFALPNWALLEHADFGQRIAAQLRADVQRGARGIKILKSFGLSVRLPDGRLIAVDDPRMDPVWRACAELRIPVAIHVGDPDAFWEPVDGTNERYEELQANPDWQFHGRDVPHVDEIREALERVFTRHPETVFVSLHVGNWPENLDYVSRILDAHPNVFIEIGARHAELGRQPRRARQLFLEHQDRVLFGTDVGPSVENNATRDVFLNYFRFLETADEYFDYIGRQGRWKIYGVDLPDDVLRKVYHGNADRIFAWFDGGPRP
jgi:predicted TIM-barrel fold metal-dependent hydrolase